LKSDSANHLLQQRISWLSQRSEKELTFSRGLEKEGLRTTEKGHISQTDHPTGLGSTLTHDHITTDYSEALLEFITPVYSDPKEALEFLSQLHQFTQEHLDDEVIWPGSMPSRIKNEGSVRIAEYGSSNIGRLKHVYRHGLWHRYGRIMQSIAGLHFNFSLAEEFWAAYQQRPEHSDGDQSLQDFKSDQYFALIRNFRRHSWLLMYLFGASPATDRSFFPEKAPLQEANKRTFVAPNATSLRMSDIGYSNNAQSSLTVCFNGLKSYVSTLAEAIHTSHLPYERIGVRMEDGYRQINTNILQIENEYYSDIRPKRVAMSGEKPICALMKRGVEYIEVRCMDLDPFEPLGIGEQQIAFLDVFLLWCLLQDSPGITDEECKGLRTNLQRVVNEGRDPNLKLLTDDGEQSMHSLTREMLQEIAAVAEVLDKVNDDKHYKRAVEFAVSCLDDPSQLPSAKIAKAIEDGWEYSDLMMHLAEKHKAVFAEQPLPESLRQQLEKQASLSLAQQQEMENQTEIPFDEFIESYQNQEPCE